MSGKQKERIPVTKDMRCQLCEWQNKTGFGIIAIFRYAQRAGIFEITKSLKASTFEAIKRGATKSVVSQDYQKLLQAYEKLPKGVWMKQHAMHRKGERIAITEEFRQRLAAFFDQTKIGRPRLFKAYGAPKDMSTEQITRILSGQMTTVAKDHAEFLERLISAHSRAK